MDGASVELGFAGCELTATGWNGVGFGSLRWDHAVESLGEGCGRRELCLRLFFDSIRLLWRIHKLTETMLVNALARILLGESVSRTN